MGSIKNIYFYLYEFIQKIILKSKLVDYWINDKLTAQFQIYFIDNSKFINLQN